MKWLNHIYNNKITFSGDGEQVITISTGSTGGSSPITINKHK
jgi:hypothetical protein